MSDDVMTLAFTKADCREVMRAIDENEEASKNKELLLLKGAMRPYAENVIDSIFLAYVRESDDEIIPGFNLSDHGLKVDRVVREEDF